MLGIRASIMETNMETKHLTGEELVVRALR
jgi:hypothetical protein